MARKTHEEYLQELKEKDIKAIPLEEYKNCKTKIRHKCEKCGNENWFTLPNAVLNGGTCCKPSNECTHENYLTKLKHKNITVKPLEPYRGARTKIKQKCVCGNEWHVTPDQVLRGHLCGCKFKEFMKTKRNTHENYLKKLKATKSGVLPLEKYKGYDVKIKHRCICGNEWSTLPTVVLRGQLCGCRKRNNPWTHERYLKELKNRGVKVVPLEEYKGSVHKILHRCICGTEWRTKPDLIIRGHLCGCVNERRGSNSHEDYLRMLKDKNIKVKPLENYITFDKVIKHKCVCGHVWKTAPKTVLDGSLCGCVKSKNEMKIRRYLNKKNIHFEIEQTFKDLKGNRNRLRYDFSILDKDKIICLIEFHGRQHFEFLKNRHKTYKKFELYQKYDKMKRDYAAKKGIPLIELTYKDKDPIKTLEKELKALGIGATKKRKYEQMSLF